MIDREQRSESRGVDESPSDFNRLRAEGWYVASLASYATTGYLVMLRRIRRTTA
jgi:hypothetical protein